MTRLIHDMENAINEVIKAFQQGHGNPNDLEDALQVVHGAKQALLALTKQVRQQHDTSEPSHFRAAQSERRAFGFGG